MREAQWEKYNSKEEQDNANCTRPRCSLGVVVSPLRPTPSHLCDYDSTFVTLKEYGEDNLQRQASSQMICAHLFHKDK